MAWPGERPDISLGIAIEDRGYGNPAVFGFAIVFPIIPVISSRKPYRIGRSKTGLGLFATRTIEKGTDIVRYFGPMLDSRNKKHEAIDNKYLFEINGRWTIDGSVRRNIARYINHSCRPNAESDVNSRKRTVMIRAIKTIHPGEEINYDYAGHRRPSSSRWLQVRCGERKRRNAPRPAPRRRLRRSCDGRDRQGAEMKTSPAQRTKPKTKAAKATKAKATKAKTPAKARRDARHRAGLMARRIHDRRGLRRDDVLLGLPMVVSFPTATPGAIHPTMSASICGCGGSAAA